MTVQRLKYGNTNTFLVRGTGGSLLIDTDYAGTLPMFFRALKAAGTDMKEITYVMATHYHPDHAGLIGELQRMGVKLLILEEQLASVHDPDVLFAREGRLRWIPADETAAEVVPCADSRDFLSKLGIAGEIVSVPSHSPDSVCVLLDGGDCIVGDLEPYEYLAAYGDNAALKRDWERVMRACPKRIRYGHANEKEY